ncbi:MAG: hypothetical protein WCP07_04070 [bacterium]|jgi:hypothetical protein
MHSSLKNVPVFDAPDFRGRTADWKKIVDTASTGQKRTVIEWGVAKGPLCLAYPASRRDLAIQIVGSRTLTGSDERWADYLEFEYVPQVVAALTADNLNPQVICIDQRPIQIMRERRRELESFAHSRAGDANHH